MLEDRDSIDMILQDPGVSVKFVILDSGHLRAEDSDAHLELLNHKIYCCLSYMEDEEKFEALGKPEDVTIEVRCGYAVKHTQPLDRSATFENGRVLNYKLVFVERISK